MRGLKRTAAGAAAIALSIGVLAGCGTSTSDAGSTAAEATETAPALTKAQFVAKANAICTKLDNTADSLESDAVDTVSAAKAQIKKFNAEAQEALAQLQALVPPAALEAAKDTLVQSSQESVKLFDELTASLEGGTVPSTAELKAQATQAMALVTKQEAAAKELGLSNCFTGVNNDGKADTADDGGDDADGNDAG